MQPRYYVYEYPQYFCVTDMKGVYQGQSKSTYYDYTGKEVIVNTMGITSKGGPLSEFVPPNPIAAASDFGRKWAAEIDNPSYIDSQTWR